MSEPGDAPASAAEGNAAGALLKAARQAQGLHVAALATTLKVPPRKLEALENGEYGEFQGPTFVRALAHAACRALKIDPAPVLELLPELDRGNLSQLERGLNTPFREHGARRETADVSSASRAAAGLVGVLVMGSLAFWFWPSGWRLPSMASSTPEPESAVISVPAPLAPQAPLASDGSSLPAPPAHLANASGPTGAVPAAVAAVSPAVALPKPGLPTPGLPTPGLSAQNLAVSPNAAAPRPAVAAPAPVASASVAPAQAVPAQAVSAQSAVAQAVPAQAVAGGTVLQLRARKASWIEVVDGQSRVLLARTLAEGESVGFDGALPMRVKIGNVAGTDLSFRGRPLDLAANARDNVARVELK